MGELGLLNFDFTSNNPVKFDKVINFKNKNYRIEFKYSQTPVYEFELQNIKEKYINKEDKVVLISNTDLEPKAQEIADEYNQSLLIIKYNNQNDLKDKISSYFKNR